MRHVSDREPNHNHNHASSHVGSDALVSDIEAFRSPHIGADGSTVPKQRDLDDEVGQGL